MGNEQPNGTVNGRIANEAFNMNQGITLRSRFKTHLPDHIGHEDASYKIYYEVKYGVQCKDWNEDANERLYQ